MRPIYLLSLIGMFGALAAGCSQKTPEEIEAAKYPPAKPLTAEEQERVKALTGLPPEANASK